MKTIPVCSCVKPDPAPSLVLPLCCNCGRLIVPDGAPIKFEVRARREAAE